MHIGLTVTDHDTCTFRLKELTELNYESFYKSVEDHLYF